MDQLVSHYKGRLTVRNGLPRRHKGKPFIVMCFRSSDNVEEDVVKVLSKLGLDDGTGEKHLPVYNESRLSLRQR